MFWRFRSERLRMPPRTFEDSPELDMSVTFNAVQEELFPPRAEISVEELTRRLCADRRARSTWLNGGLFSDPAWELLLDIFYNEQCGRQVSLRRLLVGSVLQPRTALRWIALLEAEGLVKWALVFENIKSHVTLTDKGTTVMKCYMHEVAENWGLTLSN